MERIALLAGCVCLFATAASAETLPLYPGWGNFNEPLNYSASFIELKPNSMKKTVYVKIQMTGAVPNKLYQIAPHLFVDCASKPSMLGQFPVTGCGTATYQNFTSDVAATEIAVVTTDANGNGTSTVVVGPVAPGTYNIEFVVRDGAGCNLIGGGTGAVCAADFQSGSSYGMTTTWVVQ